MLFNFEGPEKGNLQRRDKDGGIAQLGERLLCKQEVSGSIPLISTKGKGEKNLSRGINGLIAQPVRAHA